MTIGKLSELLERVNAASGPDRELDCRLSHHFVKKGISYGSGDDAGWAPSATVEEWDDAKWAEVGADYVYPMIPEYTASVDAALNLVDRLLPDHNVLLEYKRVGGTLPRARIGLWSAADSEGSSLPLAILAALLQAIKKPPES